MLVLRVTFPTSTGCLVAADVHSRTNVFFPGVHCPDSLRSVTTISLVFCVCTTFRSAPQTAPSDRPASSTTPSTTLPITRFIRCFSSLVLLAHCVHRPTRVSTAHAGSALFRQPPPSPRDGAHGRVASKR